MIVVGFDVSLRRTGVVKLEDGFLAACCVIVPAKGPRHVELDSIEEQAEFCLRTGGADYVVLETSADWQHATANSRASIEALAQARAAVLIAAYRACPNAGIVQVDSHVVREIVCGNRNASKAQVAENLRLRGFVLPAMQKGMKAGRHYVTLPVDDMDIVDALAACYWCWSIERLRAMATKGGAKKGDE